MFPLYTNGLFTSGQNLIIGLFIGIMFGFILERGGFGRASNIAPIFYFRNLRVSTTMVSAIITASTWLMVAYYFGLLDFNSLHIPQVYLWAYIVGGALFGIGMVMSGWCPGTSIVGMATGREEMHLFLY